MAAPVPRLFYQQGAAGPTVGDGLSSLGLGLGPHGAAGAGAGTGGAAAPARDTTEGERDSGPLAQPTAWPVEVGACGGRTCIRIAASKCSAARPPRCCVHVPCCYSRSEWQATGNTHAVYLGCLIAAAASHHINQAALPHLTR